MEAADWTWEAKQSAWDLTRWAWVLNEAALSGQKEHCLETLESILYEATAAKSSIEGSESEAWLDKQARIDDDNTAGRVCGECLRTETEGCSAGCALQTYF